MKRVGHAKQALCLVMITIMLMLTAAPALAASKPSGAYVVTTVEKHDRLRVRSTPGGAIKDNLVKGAVVVYKSSKSGWWYVEYRKNKNELDRGYVYKDCLTSVADMTSSKFASVDNVYVRKQHKTNSAKVKMKKGTKVKITGQKGTWVKISYKGRTGWVPAIYLKRA